MSAAALTYKGLFEAQQPVILNGITPARDCIWGQYSGEGKGEEARA